jgi:hypothetical protein
MIRPLSSASAAPASVESNSQSSGYFNRITKLATRTIGLFRNCRSSDAVQDSIRPAADNPLASSDRNGANHVVDRTEETVRLSSGPRPRVISWEDLMAQTAGPESERSSSPVTTDESRSSLPSYEGGEPPSTIEPTNYHSDGESSVSSRGSTPGTTEESLSSAELDQKIASPLNYKEMQERSQNWADAGVKEGIQASFIEVLDANDPNVLKLMQFRNIRDISNLFAQAHSQSKSSKSPFRREDLIGQGAEGAIFAPKYLDGQSPGLAIKIGLPGPILNEYAVLFQLPMDESVKGIIKLDPNHIDIFFHEQKEIEIDQLALVLPLCEGDASKTCNTLKDVDQLVKDVWPGLKHLEKNGICHRDIKPGNILLTKQGYAISDFGSASKKGKKPIEVAGTPNFMAPEVMQAYQTRERTIAPDHAADVWSMAATVFELLERLDNPSLKPSQLAVSQNEWWENDECRATLKRLYVKYAPTTAAAQILLRGLDPNPKTRLTVEEGFAILKNFEDKDRPTRLVLPPRSLPGRVNTGEGPFNSLKETL